MVMSTGAVNLDSIGAPCKLSKNMRALHWVIKVGSLRTSLDFYEQVLGMRVLRHEEFAAGGEATCNALRQRGPTARTPPRVGTPGCVL